MPEYRTPFPGIMAALLEAGINRVLAMDENTPQRLSRLADRMLQLEVEGIGITLFIAFTDRRVEVGTRSDHEPDTVISGSPLALFTMAVPDGPGSWVEPESRVNIAGDANLARDLERLFSQLEPDWEGSLSRVFGDVWGHQVAAGLKAGAEHARESAGAAGEMVEEFISREGGPLVRDAELEAFAGEVEEARSRLERLQQRLAELAGNGEETT
jgi:ubiquinone biosynthesis protein UbiJ